MSTASTSEPTRQESRGHAFLVALGLALAWWLLESSAHAFLFDNRPTLNALFPTSANELWMRSLTFVLILVGSLYAQYYIRRLSLAQERINLLAQAVQHAGEAILITDLDGRIEYANPAFTRITGHTLDEVSGKTPSVLRSGASDDTFYQQLWETISKGEVWQGAITDRRKDGTYYPAYLTIAPVLDEDGRPTHYVGIQLDRSEAVALEERLRQAQKMEALGTLVGGIAHDFNNTLATILSYTDLGEMQASDPAATRKTFGNIRQTTTTAAAMVRQLLGFVRRRSAPDRGRPPVADLKVWVEGLRSTLGQVLCEGIACSIELDDRDLGVPLEGHQIHEILLNLVRNAADALEGSPHGEIRLEARFLERGDALVPPVQSLEMRPVVRLTISDNGPGIPEALAGRIFEPFFTTKPPGKGTGLGLAMVFDIVRSAGGEIRHRQTQGGGATFEILLPWVDPAGAERYQPPEEVPQGHGETILLVDDQPLFRETTGALLESLGYRVVDTPGGAEAVAFLERNPGAADLALLDVAMPEMDGVETARRLRALCDGLPILFATGYDHGILDGAFVPGPTIAILEKPFEVEDLARVVAALLAHTR